MSDSMEVIGGNPEEIEKFKASYTQFTYKICDHSKGWFASEWLNGDEEGFLKYVKVTKVRCGQCLEEKVIE